MLLPSVMQVIFLNSKLIFTEKNYYVCIKDKTQFHMVKGIINAFDHMEFCLVLNLTMSGRPSVTMPPKIATRYVSFTTTINTR